jgi:probable HAF family extracellular repeat protein
MKTYRLAWCLGVLVVASTCFAQMYTVIDLVTPNTELCNGEWDALGINSSGQVVGNCMFGHYPYWAFRTAPNGPITNDIGSLGGAYSQAGGINNSGQVVGFSWLASGGGIFHAFRTGANAPINPATDDLGTLGGQHSLGYGINDRGQVVGGDDGGHAFRTAPNASVNPATDDLGTLGGSFSRGLAINARGHVVGFSYTAGDAAVHAFRTKRNQPINPSTDDLGTLGGTYSQALAINEIGQVIGYSYLADGITAHAFRTEPKHTINPATDDLGTLGGSYSYASGIDDYGQVVGFASMSGDLTAVAFLYSGGAMHNLNDLIGGGTNCGVAEADGINDAGQIVVRGQYCNDGQEPHLYRLDPIFKASVRPPINPDGSSIFRAGRGVIPVKFRLAQYDTPTCTLPPATIEITELKGRKYGRVNENHRRGQGNDDSSFEIDPHSCQYHYNLSTAGLDAGIYRVDISINGVMVGHALFGLR